MSGSRTRANVPIRRRSIGGPVDRLEAAPLSIRPSRWACNTGPVANDQIQTRAQVTPKSVRASTTAFRPASQACRYRSFVNCSEGAASGCAGSAPQELSANAARRRCETHKTPRSRSFGSGQVKNQRQPRPSRPDPQTGFRCRPHRRAHARWCHC